jgi:hypothetical protein
MRNYAFYSLGTYGKITIEYLVDTIGFTTENFVFAYLGISIPLMLEEVNISLTLIGIGALFVSRAFAVFTTSYFVGLFDGKKVPFSHQIVFIYAGLRGAVAFYLALNFLPDKKDSLLPVVITMILFTVIGLGGTTIFVIKLLHRCFPDDKIFKDMDVDDLYEVEKSVNLDEEQEYNNHNKDEGPKSVGMVTRLENFDKNFLQRLLRKDGWQDDEPAFYDEFGDRPGPGFDNSLEERFSVAMKKTNKGGDLSPYRNSIMHKKNIPKELSQQAIGQLSFRANLSKRFDKEDSFITPGKDANRYSINFRRKNEFSSFRDLNLLNVTMMNDKNIDFSASKRKSMRIFSQRKSRGDSKSDISYPNKHKEEGKTGQRAGKSFSPQRDSNQHSEQAKRLDDHSNPFPLSDRMNPPKEDYFSDKSRHEPKYVHQDDVVHEVAEADEDEKHGITTSQNKRVESESNSRLREGDSKDESRKNANDNIDIRVDNNW